MRFYKTSNFILNSRFAKKLSLTENKKFRSSHLTRSCKALAITLKRPENTTNLIN